MVGSKVQGEKLSGESPLPPDSRLSTSLTVDVDVKRKSLLRCSRDGTNLGGSRPLIYFILF